MGLGLAACAACAGTAKKPEGASVPQTFYTVTAEIALARHQPRVAALQYAAAAANETDVKLLERATQVATDANQGANRTRPMCIYPAWPRYDGSGPEGDAASFSCVGE